MWLSGILSFHSCVYKKSDKKVKNKIFVIPVTSPEGNEVICILVRQSVRQNIHRGLMDVIKIFTRVLLTITEA